VLAVLKDGESKESRINPVLEQLKELDDIISG
jgi:hypothetical protein